MHQTLNHYPGSNYLLTLLGRSTMIPQIIFGFPAASAAALPLQYPLARLHTGPFGAPNTSARAKVEVQSSRAALDYASQPASQPPSGPAGVRQ